MGLLEKFKKGLTKTRETVFGEITGLVKRSVKIDDELLENIEEILITGDVGMDTTLKIMESLKLRIKKEKVENEEEFLAILKEEIAALLPEDSLMEINKQPYIILVVGVNGSGKTTTIGKLAYRFKQEGKSVILGAADTFRAAAMEQLEVWAQRAGVDYVKAKPGSDPAAVAYDTVAAAVAREHDIAIIDTAGRLHTKVNLMEELAKISRVIKKKIEDAPHEILLVLDGTTGQNAVNQAKKFLEKSGVTGIVLTKLDGTAKGGAVLSISSKLNVPVKFVGLGEGIDDLQPFDRNIFAEGLFA